MLLIRKLELVPAHSLCSSLPVALRSITLAHSRGAAQYVSIGKHKTRGQQGTLRGQYKQDPPIQAKPTRSTYLFCTSNSRLTTLLPWWGFWCHVQAQQGILRIFNRHKPSCTCSYSLAQMCQTDPTKVKSKIKADQEWPHMLLSAQKTETASCKKWGASSPAQPQQHIWPQPEFLFCHPSLPPTNTKKKEVTVKIRGCWAA